MSEFLENENVFLDEMSENEIEYKVVNELNSEIRQIEKDLMDIQEINENLSMHVDLQGEELDLVEQRIAESATNTTEGVTSLERAEFFTEERKKIVRDVLIVTGGVVAGSLGFILGPIIGAITIASGISVSSGIVLGVHKLKD